MLIFRRGKSVDWAITHQSDILEEGQPAVEITPQNNQRLKIGDGTTAYKDLNYIDLDKQVYSDIGIDGDTVRVTDTSGTAGQGGTKLAFKIENIAEPENDNDAATKGYVDSKLIDLLWPLGSIFISTSPYNPSNFFPNTTWEAFATGRTLIGYSSSSENYNAINKTGGSESVSLQRTNLPKSNIAVVMGGTAKADTNGYIYGDCLAGSGSDSSAFNLLLPQADATVSPDGKVHRMWGTYGRSSPMTTEELGDGTAFDIVQPYIVVRMWKRIA